jgi:hypothetical protein
MKVGDTVEYRSFKTDEKPSHVGVVYDVQPDGIPSCRMPMVKIEGKAGYVLASHCKVVSHEDSNG